jgi:hypothetical protein
MLSHHAFNAYRIRSFVETPSASALSGCFAISSLFVSAGGYLMKGYPNTA